MKKNILTIRECVERTKEEKIPVSEYTLRRLVKTGAVPARYSGKKALVYYPALESYLKCHDNDDSW